MEDWEDGVAVLDETGGCVCVCVCVYFVPERLRSRVIKIKFIFLRRKHGCVTVGVKRASVLTLFEDRTTR